MVSCELKGSHCVRLGIDYEWATVQAALRRRVDHPAVLNLKSFEIGTKQIAWAPRRESYGCADEWAFFIEVITAVANNSHLWGVCSASHGDYLVLSANFLFFAPEIIFEANETDSHRPHEDPLIFCVYNTYVGPKWVQLSLDDHWSRIGNIFKQPPVLDFQWIETDTTRFCEWPNTAHLVIGKRHDWETFKTEARSFTLQLEPGCSASCLHRDLVILNDHCCCQQGYFSERTNVNIMIKTNSDELLNGCMILRCIR